MLRIPIKAKRVDDQMIPALQRGRRLPGPVIVAVAGALLLFACFIPDLFANLSSMGKSYAFDHFTLPRCGLAMRFGTDPFSSSADYPWYGYHATKWVSHPMLCLVFGVPTSYLSPWVGFWFMNLLYLGVQVFVLISFGHRLAPTQGRFTVADYACFASLGFFFPMYLIYTLGQYHAFAVLALALVLLGSRTEVAGFVLSALGKPLLGPSGLVYLVRGQWTRAGFIGALCALGYLPWMFLKYDVQKGLSVGTTGFLSSFFSGSIYAKYTVKRWNQEMSLAKVLDEMVSTDVNLLIRQGLAAGIVLAALAMPRQRPIGVAFGLASLWFFVFYARGHEYHLPLYIPLIAYLYTEPRGLYRNGWMASLALLLALPTTYYFLFRMAGDNMPSSDEMYALSKPLYYAFLAHKPLCGLLVAGTILYTEFWRARVRQDMPTQPA